MWYELKTPYRDGTIHVISEPVDLVAKLAVLVPKPRVNLTRFHGVFSPNSKYCVLVTPAKEGTMMSLLLLLGIDAAAVTALSVAYFLVLWRTTLPGAFMPLLRKPNARDATGQ